MTVSGSYWEDMARVSCLYLLLCFAAVALGEQDSGEWTYPVPAREPAYDTSNSREEEVQHFLRVPEQRRRRQLTAEEQLPSILKSIEGESLRRTRRGAVFSPYWPNVNDLKSHKHLKYPEPSKSVNDVLKGDDLTDEPFVNNYLDLKEQIAAGEDKLNEELEHLLLDNGPEDALKSREQPSGRFEDEVDETKFFEPRMDSFSEDQKERSMDDILDILALFAEKQAESEIETEKDILPQNIENSDAQNNVDNVPDLLVESTSDTKVETNNQEIIDSWLTSLVGPIFEGLDSGKEESGFGVDNPFKGSSSEEDPKRDSEKVENSVHLFGSTGGDERRTVMSCQFTLKASAWGSEKMMQWICEEKEPVSSEEENKEIENDDDEKDSLPILRLNWLSKISSEEQDSSSSKEVLARNYHWLFPMNRFSREGHE